MKVFSILCLVALVCHINADESSASRGILRVYDECNKSEFGAIQCLKKKAITFIDRMARMDAINFDGLKIVKNENAPAPQKPLSENELEQTLPRGLEARDQALTTFLIDSVANYVSSRTIQFSLPPVTSEELGRGLEEGRGKMKKMMSMMMMGFMMKLAAMVPVAIAGLYILAGKALIVSKVALLLAGLVALKKLVSGQKSGHQTAGWSNGGGGWERKFASNEEAQNLAYKGYNDN